MTPAEVLARLLAEGFVVTRIEPCDLWLEPTGAPAWLTAWLKEVPTPPWTNRLLLLRALDLEERPDSGQSEGTLPLLGEDHGPRPVQAREEPASDAEPAGVPQLKPREMA